MRDTEEHTLRAFKKHALFADDTLHKHVSVDHHLAKHFCVVQILLDDGVHIKDRSGTGIEHATLKCIARKHCSHKLGIELSKQVDPSIEVAPELFCKNILVKEIIHREPNTRHVRLIHWANTP